MADSVDAKFTVNGKPASVTSDPDRSVLEILREDLHLTGTKYGCGEGACGACTVRVDGQPLRSSMRILRSSRKIKRIAPLSFPFCPGFHASAARNVKSSSAEFSGNFGKIATRIWLEVCFS